MPPKHAQNKKINNWNKNLKEEKEYKKGKKEVPLAMIRVSYYQLSTNSGLFQI